MGRLLLVALAVLPNAGILYLTLRDDAGTGSKTLVWADRTFSDPQAFDRWLRARGLTYERWEARHPGASPWEDDAAGAAPADEPSLLARAEGSTILRVAAPALAAAILFALLWRGRRRVAALARRVRPSRLDVRAPRPRLGPRGRPALRRAGAGAGATGARAGRLTVAVALLLGRAAQAAAAAARSGGGRLRRWVGSRWAPVRAFLEAEDEPAVAVARQTYVPPEPAVREARPEPVDEAVPAAPPPAPDPAQVGRCAIRIWDGYVKAQFYAAALVGGQEVVVAESEPFRRRHRDGPEAQAALADLLDRLAAEGWSLAEPVPAPRPDAEPAPGGARARPGPKAAFGAGSPEPAD